MYKNYETDNRDSNTTELVLKEDCKEGDRIEVDPFELVFNLIENSGLSDIEEEKITLQLTNIKDYLNEV